MKLFQTTGGSTNDAVNEAHFIVNLLTPHVDEMTSKESKFVSDMTDCTSCSPKQLFWLRDLKEKYAE